jgi:histidinol-phosphate aminotransferase
MSDRKEASWASLLRPELAELSAYAPEPGDFEIRLDANEAPPLLSQATRAHLAELASASAWERYPDARQAELRHAIGESMGISPDRVLAGVGSDEVIAMLLTALSLPRSRTEPTVLTTTPTFVMYRLSARARGMRVVEVPLDASWDIADASLTRAIEISPPNLIFIASPNNPTGTTPSVERLRNVIEAARGSLVVLDEAYVDYADGDLLALVREFEHVAILRTLSKIGFASLRVGWLVGSPDLVRELDKVRQPYNLPSVSQRLARAVLQELAPDVRQAVQAVVRERERVSDALAALPGFEPTPSRANFVWFKSERPAGEVHAALAAKKILVRSFHARGGRLRHQLRVTIGTPSENDAFLRALSEVA